MAITPLCTDQTSVKRVDGQSRMNAVRCKRWSCEVCHRTNRRRVIAKGVEGRPTAMLTLTLSSKDWPDVDEAARRLKTGLVALRKRIARHPEMADFQFLAVFEKHKSGWPHLHLLIRGKYMDITELKAMWEGITGSFIVDVRAIDTLGKAAFYVAKYLGKDLSAFKGCKRWWRSRGYAMPKPDDDLDRREWEGWGRIEGDVRRMALLAKNLGFHVESEGPDRYILRCTDEQWCGWANLSRGAALWYGRGR